jgi:hypothetical protein
MNNHIATTMNAQPSRLAISPTPATNGIFAR